MFGRPTRNQMWLLMSAVLVFVLSTPACGGAVSPTPVPTRTPLPTGTPTPEVDVFCDVWCSLEGPAGDPASRNPQTGVEVIVQGSNVVQVVVESPSGETIAVSPYGDIPYGWEGRFGEMTEGLPQAGGTYTCTALDADGTTMVASDVYIGGCQPDPPANVQVRIAESGLLVTWDPAPVIPGAFDPGGLPPFGFYAIYLVREDGEILYGWSSDDGPLPETFHLIPFRRQDFGDSDAGLALEEMDDGVHYLRVLSFSVAPEGTAGVYVECIADDPAERAWIVIEGGQVLVKEP